MQYFLEERVVTSIEEACNPNRTERLSKKSLVQFEKFIKEFPAKYIYTHTVSSKEPMSDKVRKSMTRNVKTSAYINILNLRKKDKHNKIYGEFVDDDVTIFNFAQDLYKNTSTQLPVRLFEDLISYIIKSIAQISCGRVRGTCWLVTDRVVITNNHVMMMFNEEREELKNVELPIKVLFDYSHQGETAKVVTIEVDETWEPVLENQRLDYKFLRLKESEGLRNRVPLGPIVRRRPLQEGLVLIVGHPEGKEMHLESCVVVSSHSWREKLEQRHAACAGVHMTSAKLLQSAEKYKDCLAYDTSLFSGASGSPVIDVNGNIVAMHTQGYTLNINGGKCSLMEFGVQFNAICEDLRSYDENLLKEFFPNCMLDDSQGPADERYNLEQAAGTLYQVGTSNQQQADEAYNQDQEPAEETYDQEPMDEG